MPASAPATARTLARGRRSASTPRMASRTAVSSGPSVRSIGSPGEPQPALADDVALDVLRPASDRLREPGQVELRPVRGRRLDGGRTLDVHGEEVDPLHQLREEQADHRRLRAGDTRARRQAHAPVGHGAERVHLGARAGETARDLVVVDGAAPAAWAGRGLRQPDQLVDPARQAHLLGEEGRAALEAEGRHRHPPAVVQLAHHVAERDPHAVVEDLAEVALAGEGGDGAYLDARRVHRADDPGDAAVAWRPGVGAHEELLELRHLCEAGPHLLPGDDERVALDNGARLEAREVGARVRFRKALAPDRLATQDARQMRRLLLLAAARDERRAGVVEPDEERRDVRRTGARVLLAPDELLHERRAAAAVLARPRDAGPARLVQPPLPGPVVRGAGAELRRARRARHVGLEPGTRLGAEGLLGRAEAK